MVIFYALDAVYREKVSENINYFTNPQNFHFICTSRSVCDEWLIC